MDDELRARLLEAAGWQKIRRSCNPAKLWCKVKGGYLHFVDGRDEEIVNLSGYGLLPIGEVVSTSAGDARVVSVGDEIELEFI